MQTAQIVAVQGNFERFIRLDTEMETAFSYFTDFNYVLPRLPEIERVLRYADGRYRMIFSADDGRGHAMGIVFDIRHEMSANEQIKMLSVPVSEFDLKNDPRLVASKAKGPLFPGSFSGETLFYNRGKHIEVVYRAQINIEIDVPRFLQFMPRKVLQQLGDTLMKVKLNKVGEGMAERMTEDFDEWREQHEIKLISPAKSVAAFN